MEKQNYYEFDFYDSLNNFIKFYHEVKEDDLRMEDIPTRLHVIFNFDSGESITIARKDEIFYIYFALFNGQLSWTATDLGKLTISKNGTI